MKIVITAGGTTEPIDKVRKITNSSTGKLGSLIANELLEDKNNEIFYITTKKSILPKEDRNLKIIYIESTNDLKLAVENILTKEKIDTFIHSMAVSDYYVDYVTTASIMEESINKNNIKESILNPTKTLDNSSKLSSYENNLVVVLKQTPKIIKLIKELSPNTKLIGFKLLENVTDEELLNVAIKLKDKNDCDYVVANDLKNITKDNHKAFIINKDNSYVTVNTKLEIAQKIKELI